ncbi:MAG: SMR family transporter [Methyloceanibacter sp.]
MSPVTTYLCLAGSILTEVIATIALAASESFSKPLASFISVLCFAAAFWLLSFPLRTMPTGIVYAVWSGLSIVLVTAVAWVWTKQVLDLPALLGMALITSGVVVINVFSNSAMTEEAVSQSQSCAVAKSTCQQQKVMGSSQSQLSKSPPPPRLSALPPTPPRQVIQEGKFDWGWFRAYSDGSIEVEANGEKRWYRNFAELERERKAKATSLRRTIGAR